MKSQKNLDYISVYKSKDSFIFLYFIVVSMTARKYPDNLVRVCIDAKDKRGMETYERVKSILEKADYMFSTSPVRGLAQPEFAIGKSMYYGEEIFGFIKSNNLGG